MTEGCFIDGLQTRAAKGKGRPQVTRATGDPLARKAAAQQPLSQNTSQGAWRRVTPVSPAVRTRRAAERPPVVMPVQPRVKASEKPVDESTGGSGLAVDSDFIEPVKPLETAEVTRKTKSNQGSYRRAVLGIDDDTLELRSDDLFGQGFGGWRRRKNSEKEESHERKRWKLPIKARVGAILAVVFVVAAAVAFSWGDTIVSKITGGNAGLFDLFRSAVLSDGTARFKEDENKRTNILVFGTSGYDMEGRVGEVIHDGAQLTDSIMVISLNQDDGDVAMVSLQRDLLVGTCNAAGKINEVYLCANPNGDNENAGALALKEKVSDITGLTIHYFAHLNWSALVSVVDALGGITLTLDEDIGDLWTNTYIDAGTPVTLDGEQALGLARARHGTWGGDFTRARSQQKILMALKDKIAERGFSFTELLNIAGTMGENLRTDFSADEIAAGARLATKTDFLSVRQVPLTGIQPYDLLTTDEIGGISYVVPTAGTYDYSEIHNYLASAVAVRKDAAETGRILVLNGSGAAGVAAAEREQLMAAGFTVVDIGDAPAGSYFDKYYLYAISDQPETLEKLQRYYNILPAKPEYLPSGIDTEGVDFVLILGVGYEE